MKAVVTGGAGFLGTRVVQSLLARSADELVVADMASAGAPSDARVRSVPGDLVDGLPSWGSGVDVVYHLAGVVSGAAEADFDLGIRVNVDGLRAVLEWCRAQSEPPVLVFTSSLAVFGSDPAIGPVGVVDDDTLPRPQSSYGIQKFIGEQLVADYTRKGFVRGRSVRLMTVSVRPGAPNAAASSFLSGIIREPLSGEPAVCPVAPDTEVALSSPRKTVEGIMLAGALDDDAWGSRTAMNLPALTTTPRRMAESLDRVAGEGRSDLIRWERDPAIEGIVGSWPSRFVTERATTLGLKPEVDFDDIVQAYGAETGAFLGSAGQEPLPQVGPEPGRG